MPIRNPTDVSDAGGVNRIVSDTVVVPFEMARVAVGVELEEGNIMPLATTVALAAAFNVHRPVNVTLTGTPALSTDPDTGSAPTIRQPSSTVGWVGDDPPPHAVGATLRTTASPAKSRFMLLRSYRLAPHSRPCRELTLRD